ncbi:MAG: class I SAM-dependent methyltransferase [Planctomycetota bacterium]|nr:class I SAM-dependent methyltransferase [Planctomycetota bacterium]
MKPRRTQNLSGALGAANFLIHRITERIARSLTYQGRVVDLGCGNAPYKDIILEQADEYIGVDWENSAHDQSQVDVFADLTKEIPLESDWADTLVSFQVMEHLPEPEFFLRECMRILKPGGRLYITVPFMWRVHEAPHDYFRYTRHGLEYLLSKVQFEQIEITEYTGFWQMFVLKFNYHSLRYAKGPLKYFWVPIWLLNQTIAPWLDRVDRNPNEPVGYVVSARRSESNSHSKAKAA